VVHGRYTIEAVRDLAAKICGQGERSLVEIPVEIVGGNQETINLDNNETTTGSSSDLNKNVTSLTKFGHFARATKSRSIPDKELTHSDGNSPAP